MLTERAVDGLHHYLSGVLSQRQAPQQGALLDIGCGTGAWLTRLKQSGWQNLSGIDLNPPAPVDGIRMTKFDLNCDDPAALGRFDVITCIEVIEHLENIGRLLDLIRDALAPTGQAILTTPNVESLRARIRALLAGELPSFDQKSDPTHLFPLLRQTLAKLLARRQMHIIEILQYPPMASHTKQFRPSVNRLANLARLVFADPLHGDNVIYVIGHTSGMSPHAAPTTTVNAL